MSIGLLQWVAVGRNGYQQFKPSAGARTYCPDGIHKSSVWGFHCDPPVSINNLPALEICTITIHYSFDFTRSVEYRLKCRKGKQSWNENIWIMTWLSWGLDPRDYLQPVD